MSLWICNPQGNNCGSVTRADYKSAVIDSGITNPRGQRKPTTSQHGDFSVPVDLQSTGGGNCGSATRAD